MLRMLRMCGAMEEARRPMTRSRPSPTISAVAFTAAAIAASIRWLCLTAPYGCTASVRRRGWRGTERGHEHRRHHAGAVSHGAHADIATTGPDRGRCAAPARRCGRARIPGWIHDCQWIASGSGQRTAVIERTAGKDYTTRVAIKEMRRQCQLSARVPGSGYGQPAETNRGASSPVRLISSSTADNITPQAALRAKLIGRSESSPPTLPRNTKRLGKNEI